MASVVELELEELVVVASSVLELELEELVVVDSVSEELLLLDVEVSDELLPVVLDVVSSDEVLLLLNVDSVENVLVESVEKILDVDWEELMGCVEGVLAVKSDVEGV